MSEFIQVFVAGLLAGIVLICVLFVGPFTRALSGWERARARIENLENELEDLRADSQEGWECNGEQRSD